MRDTPVEPPSPVAIAGALSGITSLLRPDDNIERSCLEEVHILLSADPPDVDKARAELADGLAHAFRHLWREVRPESWLVAACAQLLRPSAR
jgi:hypothetical protein